MFAKYFLLSAATAIVATAALGIDTPAELKQCQETTFTISGGSGTLYPFVVDASKPCDDALAELDGFTGATLKYTPTLPVGTVVMVAIEDEDGTEAWSGHLTITAGDSTACLTSTEDVKAAESVKSISASAKPTTGLEAPVNVGATTDGDASQPDTGSSATRVAVGGISTLAALSALFALSF